MDEREIANEIHELLGNCDWPFMADGWVSAALGEAPGFVLNFPHGKYLVTVALISED